MPIMKLRSLILSAALLGAGVPALANLQMNIGGFHANGGDDSALGLELGAGFYFEHSLSSLSSSIMLNYLGFGDIDSEDQSVDVEAGYDLIALNYKLYFPLIPDRVLQVYVEGLAGMMNSDISANVFGDSYNIRNWDFGWGVGAGLQYNFTQNFGLSGGYTYIGVSDQVAAGMTIGDDGLHLLRLNLVVRF
jgi:hypothetical protein